MADPDFRLLSPRLDRADMLRKVESLGVSCELGLIQRHCKVEQAGLFRFGYTPIMGLIEAVKNGFEGVGDPARIDVDEGHANEWITTNRRYGFEFHTAHHSTRHTRDYVLQKMHAHFKFLSGKLIEEIEDGDKLLVYRAEMETNKGEMADELAKSISARGQAVLLWVMVAPTPELAGHVRWAEPGRLMYGYLDRFAQIRFAAGASYDAWLTLLQNALALMQR
jgi:hypothetical protein